MEKLGFAKMIVILISGKAGVGKTTTASILKEEFASQGKDVVIAPFAKGLKNVARSLGWDGKKDDAGRKLLIDIGRDGREYNKDVWVSMTYNKLLLEIPGYPQDIVISDDWRYPNEYDYLKNNPLYQIFRIRVYSPKREMLKGTPHYNDSSETSLPEAFSSTVRESDYDVVLSNLGSMDDLKIECQKIVNHINNKAIKW